MNVFKLFKENTLGNESSSNNKFLALSEKVKFKKDGGLRSMFGIEITALMRFHNQGELIGLHPSISANMDFKAQIILISSLESVEKLSDNKIKINFKNQKNLTITLENSDKIDDWISGMRHYMNKTSQNPYGIDDWTDITWTMLSFADINTLSQVKIIKDLENDFFESFENAFNFDIFLDDKGLDDMLTFNPEHIIKNRLLISKAGFEEIPMTVIFNPEFNENDTSMLTSEEGQLMVQSGIIQTDRIKNLMNNFSEICTNYILLVSNIPMVDIDQELFRSDQNELSEIEITLHHEVEFYSIYVYEHTGKGDYLGAIKVIPLEEMEFVYINPLTSNLFEVCLGNHKEKYKIYLKRAFEAYYWSQAIRNCIEISRRKNKSGMQKFIQTVKRVYIDLEKGNKMDIKKTLDEILTDNLEIIEECRWKSMKNQIDLESVGENLTKIKVNLVEGIKEVDYFLDAFVNHDSFNDQFFQYIVVRFGSFMRYFFYSMWAVLIKYSTSLLDFLNFVNLINNYKEMLSKWKVVDSKLFEGRIAVCYSVSKSMLESSRGAITNLLISIFSPPKEIRGKLQSLFLIQAFSHFNFLASTICKFDDDFPEIKIEFLRNIQIMIECIFLSIFTELDQKELDIEQSLAVGNCNGMIEFDKFLKSMVNYTKLSLKQVKEIINEEYFDRCIIKLESICFKRFITILERNFNDMISKYMKGIFIFEINSFLNDFMQEHHDLINSYDIDQREQIMESLMEIFLKKYFENIFKQAHLVNKRNIDQFKEKLEVDFEISKNFFEMYITDKIIFLKKLFHELNLLLEVEDYEGSIINLINIHSLYPETVGLTGVEKLLSMKIYFSNAIKLKMMEEFTAYFEGDSANKKVKENLLIFTNFSNPLINQFARNFLKIVRHNRQMVDQIKESEMNFLFMYEKNAYEMMLQENSERLSRRASMALEQRSIPSNVENMVPVDSMKDVVIKMTEEEELENKFGNKIFHMIKVAVPAVNDQEKVEKRLRELKNSPTTSELVYLHLEEEIIKISSDFFGNKNPRIYELILIDDLRTIGKSGISFNIGQKCFGYFFVEVEKEKKFIDENQSDTLFDLIENRKLKFEKNLFDGVNLFRLNDFDISDKLNDFHLQLPSYKFQYNFSHEKDQILKNGGSISKGRKKSLDLQDLGEDLF